MKDLGTPGELTIKSEQDENRRIIVAIAIREWGYVQTKLSKFLTPFLRPNLKALAWDCRLAGR
jgi:hypothetical protein